MNHPGTKSKLYLLLVVFTAVTASSAEPDTAKAKPFVDITVASGLDFVHFNSTSGGLY